MFQQTIKSFSRIAAAAVLAIVVPGTWSPAQAQGDEPFLGQTLYVSFNFAPRGWAFCNGQTLPINQNQALFSLLGTTYGGNGTINFQLPNLQGRAPLHQGAGGGGNYVLGQTGGSQSATLTSANLPSHTHSVSLTAQIQASSANATSSDPTGHLPANTVHNLSYSTSAPNVSLSDTVSVSGFTDAGGSASPTPVSTMPPYTTVNCVIALAGIFPSRN
ncbi:MAG: phage Tail Collar domain protein [Nevskia sp.]|nr:phage Tail Collar domain protein [Nevskia sp.]